MAWVSPRTYVAAAVLTAAQLNETRDSMKAIGDAWTAYTPTWSSTGTAPAIGNGTLTGAYIAAGKWIVGRFTLTAGSTTTYGTGTYSFSTPVTAKGGVITPLVSTHYNGATFYSGSGWVDGSNNKIRAWFGSAVAEISPTVPTTWANGHIHAIAYSYEAA